MIKLFLNSFDIDKNKKIILAINKSMVGSISWDIGMLVDDFKCLQYAIVFDRDMFNNYQISLNRFCNSNLSKELKSYNGIDNNKIKDIFHTVKEDIKNQVTNHTTEEILDILRECGLKVCCDLNHFLEDKEANCDKFIDKLLSYDVLLNKKESFTEDEMLDFSRYISSSNKKVKGEKSFKNALDKYILSKVDNESKEKIMSCYKEYIEVMNELNERSYNDSLWT